MKRLESNRALYMRGSRQQLVELIRKYDPRLIAGAIIDTLELQIAIEDIASAQGVEINDAIIAEFSEREHERLDKEVNRALISFIASIVSQET